MKIIAHRGWSIGKKENTLEAFQKAVENKLDGVEFDIRWSQNRGKIVISHDPDIEDKAISLEETLAFLADKNLELLIEFKEYDKLLFKETLILLERFDLKKKAILFGFSPIVENFDWSGEREVRLGVITKYPWLIKSNIKNFNPDGIFIGWDYRWWAKPIFKLVWSVFSLPKVCKKYSSVKFIVGISQNEIDYNWLCKQEGLYCCTVDMPLG